MKIENVYDIAMLLDREVITVKEARGFLGLPYNDDLSRPTRVLGEPKTSDLSDAEIQEKAREVFSKVNGPCPAWPAEMPQVYQDLFKTSEDDGLELCPRCKTTNLGEGAFTGKPSETKPTCATPEEHKENTAGLQIECNFLRQELQKAQQAAAVMNATAGIVSDQKPSPLQRLQNAQEALEALNIPDIPETEEKDPMDYVRIIYCNAKMDGAPDAFLQVLRDYMSNASAKKADTTPSTAASIGKAAGELAGSLFGTAMGGISGISAAKKKGE